MTEWIILDYYTNDKSHISEGSKATSYAKYISNRHGVHFEDETVLYSKTEEVDQDAEKKEIQNSSKINKGGKVRRPREARGESNVLRNYTKSKKYSNLIGNHSRAYRLRDTKVNYFSSK